MFIALFSYVGLSAEYLIGRRAETGTLGSYEYAWNEKGKGKLGYTLAYIPLLGSMSIAIGYAIISAWVLRTFGAAVTGKILEVDTAQFFGEAVQGNFVILPWHIAVIVITLLTLFAGASSIEKTNKIMMPAFFVLFFILAVRVAFLPGAIEGYKYLFVPDWSYLFNVETWVNAMGQAFFSLSITGSGMIVCGAYLDKKEDIVIVKSPVGYPGRAIKTNLIKNLVADDQTVKCYSNCVAPCNLGEGARKVGFCIANCLGDSYNGKVDTGLFFSGENGYRVNKLVSVEELINELMTPNTNENILNIKSENIVENVINF